MMLDPTGEDSSSLLDEAARHAAGMSPAGVGDLRNFLGAYYGHLPPEDLLAADPFRLAAVAAEHARLAASRPQGRALVQLSFSGACAALEDSRGVVDIVTDDMPFLVDSITMELARRGLDSYHIIHPQLLVRRDVTGTMWEVVGPLHAAKNGHDEIIESWTHIEVDTSSPAALADLERDLQQVLLDVRAAVEDYPKMAEAAVRLADRLGAEGQATETQALLRWLVGNHFTFLGYREYDLVEGPQGMALVPLPGTGLGILRHDKRGSSSFAALPPEVRARAKDPQRLILTKANSRSTVHRNAYLDYIAIKRVDGSGAVVGEFRFLGLYTHDAYHESIARIPVLRRKLGEVLERTGATPESHDAKDLTEILESYPREELFQISVDELVPIALGVLHLRSHPQTRLFLRKDVYGRFMACVIYLPRDRYTTPVRLRAQEILREALGGETTEYSATVGDSPLARLLVVVRAQPGTALNQVNRDDLEDRIVAAARTWDEDLAAAAAHELGDGPARALIARFTGTIPETYKADVPASFAINDLVRVQDLLTSAEDISFDLWEAEGYVGGQPVTGDRHGVWRLTIYRVGTPITLTDVLPRLQHMGVDVVDEHPYQFAGPEGQPFWIYDFGLRRTRAGAGGNEPVTGAFPVLSAANRQALAGMPSPGQVKPLFEDALSALWQGKIEDDGFNALVLDAQLSWRQIVVLRAYAKYLRQAGITFSQRYIERVLAFNVPVTRLLVRLFESRFDPAHEVGAAERGEAIGEEIRGLLDEVEILDHDRILRSYLGLVQATQRTNYFRVTPSPGQPGQGSVTQERGPGPAGGSGPWGPGVSPGGSGVPPRASGAAAPAPYLVLKLDAAAVPELPDPRPRFEAFVYSPRLEAVHLRFAPVARGGLRWSDRREDFRTEILGLAKAQEVKNSVIVPSGAKGGFVCKHLPDPSDREAYQAEVLACYKTFIAAMLDITDNLHDGRVVPPPEVVRHDGDDTYLVVAADKGTATFSDTANEIAQAYGYWLGDAFASGGSVGYDHKGMGITARGAWESVKFHFATFGLDPDTTDFTVAGIGDMSGDVFGNGMLLSRHIRLIAAFDHRHVFLDPNPDPAASFAERQRMFALPRSSWADYDPALISTGGGVWPRTAKSIPLSPQASQVLGLGEGVHPLAPDQLISAILAAPVDLLWNGGIGTYIKASNQSHDDAGDRANDGVRIDASRLRAKVIAEGGNLGLTQAARIEYALAGGLVNTDFIDNSAGVDTSDHEVNIKILLQSKVNRGELTPAARGELLHEMTDEVAALVLRQNYGQNRALAAAGAQSAQMLHVHTRYLRRLEREHRIGRRLDSLPGDREIAERRSAGLGLTVPEFALLLAQAKISAVQKVLDSTLPDDRFLRSVLVSYFPEPLRGAYAGEMDLHPLRREIVTTMVVNDMVNRSGTTFLFRMNEETGAPIPDISWAWLVAREVYGMAEFWERVERLDGQVSVATQTSLLLEGRKLTERAVRWLLQNCRPPFDLTATIGFFAEGVQAVSAILPKLLTGPDLVTFTERQESAVAREVPGDLAERVAAMVPAYSAFDIVEVAASTGSDVTETAGIYFSLAGRLQIARLRDQIVALPRDDRWNTMARGTLRDDLYSAHAALVRDVLLVTGPGSPDERLAQWAERNEAAVRSATQTLTEIWETERSTLATLSVAVRAVRTLVAAGSQPARS